MVTKKSLSALKMAYISLGAVLIALCSWISVPATVPFTLQTFAVLLVCDLLGGRWGLVSVLLYLLLGAVGFPVFSGFSGGLGHLLGMTGGYILGFVLSALVMALMQRLLPRRRVFTLLSMALGLLACYAFGTLWFVKVYGDTKGPITLLTALSKCVFPFIVPDLAKLALALWAGKRLEKYRQ